MLHAEYPLVEFSGQILCDHGDPVRGGVCVLEPQEIITEFNGVWIATWSYPIDLDENGRFKIMVLPTNMGVQGPWHYFFHTPVRSYTVELPYGGPHDFNKLVEKKSEA